MELPRGSPPPPDEYFASEFNVITSKNNSINGGGFDNSPKWSLRGFLPPAHLRIELYRYLNRDVCPEESEEESPAGRLTPTPRTPQRSADGESIEMLAKGVLAWNEFIYARREREREERERSSPTVGFLQTLLSSFLVENQLLKKEKKKYKKKNIRAANAQRERWCPRHWTEEKDAFFFVSFSLFDEYSLGCSMMRKVAVSNPSKFYLPRPFAATSSRREFFGVVVVVVKNSFCVFAKVFICSRCQWSC